MTRPARVLMVCSGNICRSPAMHYLAGREWADAAEVRSAGTWAELGMDATREIRRAARERAGLEMPRHRPTQLDSALLAQSDLVLVATRQHVRWIEQSEGALPPHVFVLKEAVALAQRAPAPAGGTAAGRLAAAAAALHDERLRDPAPLTGLDDPWSHPQEVFDRVMDEIVEAIDALGAWAGV
ncbi:hypothetical protein RN607_10685 [Demequina capsici]|uniref:Phosphotyrosine protein phosphatase I domain-containing protein n=1 Tax=Demequina capsici TaxID=3075620 RepID=A0AA96J9S7_9MICO|nr:MULTISPECIES: hypothetical protein [unclassified Demequina]WNM23821.1 hypothetical protein RN606_10685 [Demequina sp. OYTSA14]WNM26660.1 hypothetical protein RN607_10685 [Demequina sp. PMTSA13]